MPVTSPVCTKSLFFFLFSLTTGSKWSLGGPRWGFQVLSWTKDTQTEMVEIRQLINIDGTPQQGIMCVCIFMCV